MKTTIFTFAVNVRTWYIDHTTEPDVKKPYSVFCDDVHVGSRTSLGAAFEIIADKIGYCQLEKIQSLRS